MPDAHRPLSVPSPSRGEGWGEGNHRRLVATEAKRGPHRQARPRRPLPGMLLHTDASTHAWIPGQDGQQDLIAVLDDATSAAYYAQFVPQESTRTMLAALKAVIVHIGVRVLFR